MKGFPGLLGAQLSGAHLYAIKTQRKARNSPSRGHFILGALGALSCVFMALESWPQQQPIRAQPQGTWTNESGAACLAHPPDPDPNDPTLKATERTEGRPLVLIVHIDPAPLVVRVPRQPHLSLQHEAVVAPGVGVRPGLAPG